MTRPPIHSQNPIDLKKIPVYQWGLLLALMGLTLFLSWKSVSLFLAERHYREGFYLSQHKYYSQAVQELTQAVDWAPWEPQYQLHLGKAIESKAATTSDFTEKIKLYLSTIPIYTTMIKLNNHNPWYKNRLAFVYQQLSQLDSDQSTHYYSLSKQFSKEAAETDHQNPLFLMSYAQVLHQEKDYVAAKSYYQKIMSIDDQFYQAYYNLGDIYIKENNIKEAIKLYEHIYQKNQALNKSFEDTAIVLGQLYVLNDNPAQAIPLLSAQYETSPFDTNILYLLGISYFKTSQFKNASALFSEHLDISPAFHIYRLKWTSDLYLGKKPQVKRAVHAYLRKNPNSTDAQQFLKSIQ